jgi:membrane protein
MRIFKVRWWIPVSLLLLSAMSFSDRLLIGIYLGKEGVASTYGAAGSLVLVPFWVYYSAHVFFLGAAFTRVFAERYGSKPRVRHQQPLVDQTGVPVTRLPSPATVITPETDAPAPKT